MLHFFVNSNNLYRGQPKCLQKHGALLQLVRATIMALKSESASQMDHLQALEKVSPKLASREGRYRSVSSFVCTSLICLKIYFTI